MKTNHIATANLGFPRIGLRRELKSASEAQLEAAAGDVRRARWELQSDAGIARIPSNDFSLYDHVLDTAVMTGAIPSRYTRPQYSDRENSTPADGHTNRADVNNVGYLFGEGDWLPERNPVQE